MIQLVLEEFYSLSNNDLHKMFDLKRWHLKYSFLYGEINELHKKMYLYEIDDCVVRLPPLNLESSAETNFLELYKIINSLNVLHSREEYFKVEVESFKKIKENTYLLNQWLIKNELLGTEEFVCFLIDYLDYSDEVYHLQVNNPIKDAKPILVDRKSFQNTIEFLEIFNEQYW